MTTQRTPRTPRSSIVRRSPRTPIYRFPPTKRRLLFSTPIGSRKRIKYTPRRTVFSRTAIGEPVGSTITKAFGKYQSANFSSRTLGQETLTAIARGTALNERLTDSVNIRGFSVKALFRSNGTIVVNMAVVAVKDPDDATKAVNTTEFFRTSGLISSRAVSFSNGLSPTELHMLPLNSDKFTVLKHERWNMYPASAGIQEYLKGIDWYIPLNRQTTYTDSTAASCRDSLHVIYWCDQPTAATGSAPVANQCNLSLNVITHFREIF